MEIVALIITHNRLPLLKECVEQIRRQTYRPSRIVVVNNGSTDGTAAWLQDQTDVTTISQENLGGAYGFYTGIKHVYDLEADWMWIMDDDTIPTPTALEQLVQKLEALGPEQDNFGFLSSRVNWTDGSLNNKNKVLYYYPKEPARNKTSVEGLELIRSATFVSIMISRKAVEKAGLPIKEFFIWYDDLEYLERIHAAGFRGGYVADSVVLHKTADNLCSDLFCDDKKVLWKYYYGVRNELYVRKYKKGKGSFYRNIFKRMVYWPILIVFKRPNSRWPFIKTMWKGALASLSFDPPKEYVSVKEPQSGVPAGRG